MAQLRRWSEGQVHRAEIRKSCDWRDCDAAAMARPVELELPQAFDAAV